MTFISLSTVVLALTKIGSNVSTICNSLMTLMPIMAVMDIIALLSFLTSLDCLKDLKPWPRKLISTL